MKRFKILLASVFALTLLPNVAPAQDVDECMLSMSIYQEYYKQGSKESKMAALPSWRKAYSICAPGTRQNLYIHGTDLYRMLIRQNANNPDYRSALIDTLITLHELRAEYYPKYADKAYANLCMDVNNYLKDDPKKSYDILTDVITKQGYKAGPSAFVAQMNAAVSLYKDGKLDAETIINIYDVASSSFSEIQKTDTTKITRDLRATVENAFINSKVASCENLQQLFAGRFEENKNDVETVTKIVRLMASAEDCTDNDLFLKAATQMHALNPSANSAYYLFRLNASENNSQEALKYLNEALASTELDDITRAQYTYELAVYSFKNGKYVNSVEAANKAISLDSSLAAKAYMIIAQCWMGTSCGGDEIEVRAKFWVAADYFAKAKNADPSLAEDANRQIGVCASYYPQTAEAFMHELQNGQSYTAVCGGLRAATTVRTR